MRRAYVGYDPAWRIDSLYGLRTPIDRKMLETFGIRKVQGKVIVGEEMVEYAMANLYEIDTPCFGDP